MRQQLVTRRSKVARASLAGATALFLAIGLAACDRGTDPPPPGGDKPYPNLGSVPPRAIATPSADRAAMLGSLQRDREAARYDSDLQPVDEAVGSTVGAVVGRNLGRNDALAVSSPAPDLRVQPNDRPGGPPPAGGATIGPTNQQPNSPARSDESRPSPTAVEPTPLRN